MHACGILIGVRIVQLGVFMVKIYTFPLVFCLFFFLGGGVCEENFIEISNDQLCMKNTAVSFTLPRQPPFLCIVEFLNTSEPQH